MADKKKDEQQKKKDSAVEAEEARLQKKVDESFARSATTKFEEGERYGLPSLLMRSFGVEAARAEKYTLKPERLKRGEIPAETPVWRVELQDLKGAGTGTLGIDIPGDLVIGRGTNNDDKPDIDLREYGAGKKGVSRRHAMLRPTKNQLYIIDLGSTNGTMLNAVPIGKGVAKPVKDRDTVTLGRLSFTIRLIAGANEAKVDDASPESTKEEGVMAALVGAKPSKEPEKPAATDNPPVKTAELAKDKKVSELKGKAAEKPAAPQSDKPVAEKDEDKTAALEDAPASSSPKEKKDDKPPKADQ
ncbi:MAG: FHA domain-containing protein [Anaerolineae bacterium]